METGFYFALYMVGMTGLEPATSRPPDACANQLRYIPIDIKRKTNDRKILSVSVFATAKVLTYYENCKFSNIFFVFTDYICYFCTYNIYVRAKTKQPRNPIIQNRQYAIYSKSTKQDKSRDKSAGIEKHQQSGSRDSLLVGRQRHAAQPLRLRRHASDDKRAAGYARSDRY